MTFLEALEHLIQGKKIRRICWADPDNHLESGPNFSIEDHYPFGINKIANYAPSVYELQTTDWEIYTP